MWRDLQRFFERLKFYLSAFWGEEYLANFSFSELITEIHLLAYVYHWDRKSLWDMSSTERKLWVKMVLSEKKAEEEAVDGSVENNSSVSTYSESS